MPEQYDIAAVRHERVAKLLWDGKELDDAAYHYGIAGETALKYALQVSGCEAAWIAMNRLRGSPMREHFKPTGGLTGKITADSQFIHTNASGRLSAPLLAEVANITFAQRFKGWSIDIRYADSNFTPVVDSDVTRFSNDALDLLLGLVL